MGLPRRPYAPAVHRQRKRAAAEHKTARERAREEAAREAWWRNNRPPAGDQPMRFEKVGAGPSPAGFSGAVAGTDPTNSDVEYEPDELEFLRAVHRYQRERGRKFPTFVEILDVARSLGYRKVADPSPLPSYRQPQQQE